MGYRYFCTQRPPMPGGIPNGAINVEYFDTTMEDAGGHVRHVYGAVWYDRKLTDKEVYEYELEPEEGMR